MANLDLIVRALRAQCPGLEILEHEPMRAHCSFRIGGPARALVRPVSAEETAAVCRIVREGGAQPLIIGNGTNLLITDGALERIVVQMGDNMAAVTQPDATHLSAGAGIPLARLAQAALSCGLAGLEFAHGIPGSLGGAVSMNAGAYGGEMKDVVVSTRYLDGSCACVRRTAMRMTSATATARFPTRTASCSAARLRSRRATRRTFRRVCAT